MELIYAMQRNRLRLVNWCARLFLKRPMKVRMKSRCAWCLLT